MIISNSTSISFFEESMYIGDMIENERENFLNLTEGLDCVEETNIVGDVIERVKKFFAMIINAVKNFFRKVIDFFIDKIKKIKDFFTKKKKPRVEDLSHIDDNYVICKTRTYFDPMKINFSRNAIDLSRDIGDKIERKIRTMQENTTYSIDGDPIISKEEICKKVSELDVSNVDTMKTRLKEELLGKELDITKPVLRSNMNKFEYIVFNDAIPNNIKKYYSNEEQALKRVEKDMCDSFKRHNTSEKIFNTWTSIVSTISRVSSACYSTAFDVYNRMYQEYANIFIKCAQILEPPKRDEDNNDIYYNKHKFDSGEINIACVTGYSGAGKSTMTASMADSVQVIDLDQIFMYANKPDSYFERMSPVVKKYMLSSRGKAYRAKVTAGFALKNLNINNMVSIWKDMFYDVFKFVKQYAASHKDQKFLFDGVWVFMFSKPREWDDYCVLLKGTSGLTSSIRAGKRGNINGKKGSIYDSIIYAQKRMSNNISFATKGQFKKFVDYFGPKYEEQKAMLDIEKKTKKEV